MRRMEQMVDHTPIYTGPPVYPLSPTPDPRMLALPSCIGGLQTGCATDGQTIFTNGIDAVQLGSQERAIEVGVPPTGGRVVALRLDTKTERWRHERPRVATIGGPPPKAVYKDVGDPVASGIAVANGVVYFTAVASGKLVALNAEHRQPAQGDRDRAGVVRALGLARQGLCWLREYALRAGKL